MLYSHSYRRYSVDVDGQVYDALVEYCIDILCGETDHYPEYFGFAVNRVIREYLFQDTTGLNWYKPIPIGYNAHIGYYVSADDTFIMGEWLQSMPYMTLRIDNDVSVYGYVKLSKHKKLGRLMVGPVSCEQPTPGYTDMALVLTCLLLCREVYQRVLPEPVPNRSAHRNNHKGHRNGEDKA